MINDIETYIKRIAKNREDFKELAAAIKGNKDLTIEGKSTQLNDAWKAARVKHDELKKELDAEIEAMAQEKRERAFSVKSADEAQYQAALLAASKAADDKQLTKLLNRARLTNSDLLLRAIAAVGFEKKDFGILAAVGEVDRDVQDLMDFERSVFGSLSDNAKKFNYKMVIAGPSAPPETNRETLNTFGN